MGLTLRHERDENGVVRLWVDQPEKPVVVLDSWLLGQIDAFLDWVGAGPAPSGFILHSTSDRVFIAGADLNEIGGLDDAGLDRYLALGQRVFDRIAALKCPSVACISGDALGGGLEICLACQYRVAVEPSGRMYQIGLPEAKLGILPGWGGTQRLGAIVKPSVAIGRTTTGRTFTPPAALRHGVVDALVPRDQLDAAAVRLIDENPQAGRPRVIQDRKAEVASAVRWARQCRTRPVRRLPAADRVVDAIETGMREGLTSGLKAERRYLIELRGTEESKGMLGAFFARGSVLKGLMKGLQEPPTQVERVAIMGDSDVAAALEKALGRKLSVQRLDSASGAIEADLVIEAAGDDRAAQMAALRAISGAVGDETIIATTSPVLGMGEISESITNPARLVGFVPVRPLGKCAAVEVVRGEPTSDAVFGAALNLTKVLGAVPIAQRAGGPTLIVRLFGTLAMRAWKLAVESGDPAAVDCAARQEGLAVGPLEVLDRLGLRRAAALVDRLDQIGDVDRVFAAPGIHEPSPAFAAQAGGSGSTGEIEPFAIDALREAGMRAVDDGLVDDPEVVWLAAVFGLGLGPWRRDWLTGVIDLSKNQAAPTR